MATVRPMTVHDFGAVYELGTRCYRLEDKPYNYWSIGEVADHLGTSPELCLVAEQDAAVVGFVLGAPEYESIRHTGHLEWLAVGSEARGRGVATQLVESILAVYRSIGQVRVVADVSSDNRASRALFAKLGFGE